ncbi:Hypothetical protein NTJ_04183 [Nesidiocoris tenuis]|uniref:DM domain-containing protein n=1 Tax=Nesidiocoris tenuis TaxID=355587 RepID=A0ABN7AGH8_9HEMI|nr:Hypothetical protein NTJ_04183 [Nesidiocoris tenuis]
MDDAVAALGGSPRLMLKKRKFDKSMLSSSVPVGTAAGRRRRRPSSAVAAVTPPPPVLANMTSAFQGESGSGSSPPLLKPSADAAAAPAPSGSPRPPFVNRKTRLLNWPSDHSAASLATSYVNGRADRRSPPAMTPPPPVLQRMAAFQLEPPSRSPSSSGSESGGSPLSFSAARTSGLESVAGPSGSSRNPKSILKKRHLLETEAAQEQQKIQQQQQQMQQQQSSDQQQQFKKKARFSSSPPPPPPPLKKLKNNSAQPTAIHLCGFCKIHDVTSYLRGHLKTCKFRLTCICPDCIIKRDNLAVAARKVANRRKDNLTLPEPVGESRPSKRNYITEKPVLKPVGKSRLLIWEKICSLLKDWRFHEDVWPLVYVIIKHVTSDVVRIGELILESYSELGNAEIDVAALRSDDNSSNDDPMMIPLRYQCWRDSRMHKAKIANRNDYIIKTIFKPLAADRSPAKEPNSVSPPTTENSVLRPEKVGVAGESLGGDTGRLSDPFPYSLGDSHQEDLPPPPPPPLPPPPPFSLAEGPPPPFVDLSDVHHRLAAAAADRSAVYGALCSSADWPPQLENRPQYPPPPLPLPLGMSSLVVPAPLSMPAPLALPTPFAHPSSDMSSPASLDGNRPTYITDGCASSDHPDLTAPRVIGGDPANAAVSSAAHLPPSPPFYIPRSLWPPEIRV